MPAIFTQPAMPEPISFTCFPRLPAEIRLQVWKCFALPEAPILYICHYEPNPYGRPWGLPDVGKFSRPVLNVTHVNSEARIAILGRRECYLLAAENRHRRDIYFEGRRFRQDRAEHVLYGIFDRYIFIDTKRDGFYFPIRSLHTLNLREQRVPGRAQNLIVDIGGRDTADFIYRWMDISWGLESLLNATKTKLTHTLARTDMRSICSMTLVINHVDFESLYRKSVPLAVPSMSVYSYKYLDARSDFGLIPLPTQQDLRLGFEDDPQGYAIAETWHRDTLVYSVDNFVKTMEKALSFWCEQELRIRMAVAPVAPSFYRGWKNHLGQCIDHFPVVFEGVYVCSLGA
ncbi:hypothetical protein GGR52DRAFT_219304 [Hypoxylon sp. FL1284]|nr:hypothetical protein GGR52DRAFT_219304 [Hypoxylon sp. FL1284]